jgi:hypothetical protein
MLAYESFAMTVPEGRHIFWNFPDRAVRRFRTLLNRVGAQRLMTVAVREREASNEQEQADATRRWETGDNETERPTR